MARRALLASLAAAVAAAQGLESPDVLGVTSHFFVGSGAAPEAECAVGHQHSTAKEGIFSTYGAGGAGAMWQQSSLVISFSAASDHFAADSTVGLRLRFMAKTNPFVQASVVHVSALTAAGSVPGEFNWKGNSCPPSFCLMPEVNLPGAAAPDCGFGKTGSTITTAVGPSSDGEMEMEIDVTQLVRERNTRLRVWVAPSELSQEGMWSTPKFTLASLNFHGSDNIRFV